MKISSVSIFKLFGANTTLDISFVQNSPYITILHGPNGIGKTTILHLIQAALNGDLEYMYKTYFKKLTIRFDNKFILVVTKEQEKPLTFNNTFSAKFPYIRYEDSNKFEATLKNVSPNYFHHKDYENFYDEEDDDEADEDENEIEEDDNYIQMNKVELERMYYFMHDKEMKDYKKFKSYITKLKKDLSVHMINTNRLSLDSLDSIEELLSLNNLPGRIIPLRRLLTTYSKDTVIAFSKHLSKEINLIKTTKENESENLDSSFPQRLLALTKKKKQDKQSLQKIQDDLDLLVSKRSELSEAGIIDLQNDIDFKLVSDSIQQGMIPVLELYIEDNLKKLSYYDSLLPKIKLFLEIINIDNKLTDKEMVISPEGIKITSKYDPDYIVPLERLSSGEKHIIILYYYLIFLCPSNNSIILIDEPEISMHIQWQEEFIKCISKIAVEKNIQAIVTTHSPNILNGHMPKLRNIDIIYEDK